MMGKMSNENKMRIQTLCEQEFRAKTIRASYPDKNWSFSILQTICRRVDETGSAVTRRSVCCSAAGEHFEHSVCLNTEWADDMHLQYCLLLRYQVISSF